MEGKKELVSGSSPSFTSELFGSKDSSSSSSGILNSIFPPSKKLFKREYLLHSEVVDKRPDFGTKSSAPDTISRGNGGECKSLRKREKTSFSDQEQRVQPCHLSSSIYYGGQDDYNSPNTTQSSSYPIYNKDGVEDEGFASRGNWWKGSLYY